MKQFFFWVLMEYDDETLDSPMKLIYIALMADVIGLCK